MRGKSVKEEYGGEGGLQEVILLGDGGLNGRALGFYREEWSFGVSIVSVSHQGCWRFWARGPGYPYDILELGSFPSWQGG